jgi:hypothetical protein
MCALVSSSPLIKLMHFGYSAFIFITPLFAAYPLKGTVQVHWAKAVKILQVHVS